MALDIKTSGGFMGGDGGGGFASAFEEQVIPDTPTGDDAAQAAAFIAEAETYPQNVYVDADLTAEFNGINTAVARTDANVVMLRSGNYSDSTKFYNLDTATNVAPTAGDRVLIARTVDVTYDLSTGLDEEWIRCDGTWTMDDAADRQVTAETTYFSSGSELNIGSVGTPWPENRFIDWEPYNTGEMSTTKDAMLLRRGLIAFAATFNIHCPEKVNFALLDGPYNSGVNQVTLDRPVASVAGMMDWQVGDRIEIGGHEAPLFTSNTLYRDNFAGWGIDVMEIQSIANGATSSPTITFTTNLQNDHLEHATYANGQVPVMNMTRNFLFASPNREATEVWRRPHFLLKTDEESTVKGIEFVACGRTHHDPSSTQLLSEGYGWADFFYNDAGKVEPWDGPKFMASVFLDVDAIVTDFDPYDDVDLVGQQSGAVGVLGAWSGNTAGSATLLLHSRNGIAFQDGEQILQENGIGDATVNGTETSAAMSSARTIFKGRYAAHLHRAGQGQQVGLTPKTTIAGCTIRNVRGWGCVHHDSHADFLRNNCSDWLSAAFASEGGGGFGRWADNCAFGQGVVIGDMSATQVKNGGTTFGGYGTAFWHNARLIINENNIAGNCILAFHWNSRSSFNNFTSANVVEEEVITYGLYEIPGEKLRDQDFAPIQGVNDCIAFACQWGFSVSKGQANQSHDFRSMFRRFIAWGVENGMNVDYTGHYTFLDCDFYGLGGRGIGVNFRRQGADLAMSGGSINDFRYGLNVTDSADGGMSERRNHRVIGTVLNNISQWDYSADDEEITSFPYSLVGRYTDLHRIETIDLGDGTAGSARWAPDEDESVYDHVGGNGNGHYVLLGDMTDSIGTHARTSCVVHYPDVATFGTNIFCQTQADLAGLIGVKGNDRGIFTLLTGDQIRASCKQKGVWHSINGDWVHLLEDFWMDTATGEPTYFYHPIVIRCTPAQFSQYGSGGNYPVDNGELGIHNAGDYDQDFTNWLPAGPTGLT